MGEATKDKLQQRDAALRVFASRLSVRIANQPVLSGMKVEVPRPPNSGLPELQRKTEGEHNCPAKKDARVLWNHISKTGGTAVAHLLKGIVEPKDLMIQEDIDMKAHLNMFDKENSY